MATLGAQPAASEAALAALISKAQGLSTLVRERQAAGGEAYAGFGDDFFEEEVEGSNLVDEVLREKDETLRQVLDENEELRAQLEEYQETVSMMMAREEAHKETLEYERETQESLRNENTALRQKLLQTTQVIRTVVPGA